MREPTDDEKWAVEMQAEFELRRALALPPGSDELTRLRFMRDELQRLQEAARHNTERSHYEIHPDCEAIKDTELLLVEIEADLAELNVRIEDLERKT